MSTTLPPAPPRPPEIAPDDLEALIKEARRRALRRRALYALSALLAAGAATAGFAGFHGGGGHALPRPATKPFSPASHEAQPTARPRLRKNGPLAIVDGADSARIVVVGLTGRLVRSLPICRDPKCGGVTSVAWSPDGRTLAYGTASAASWHPQDGLHLFDAARNKDRRIDAGYGNWQNLAWSPDGTKLAYVNAASIYLIRLAHPGRPVLVRNFSTSPSWSPKGRLIAYDRCHGGRYSGIDVARPDGTLVRHLRRFGCAPAWSPDGSRIAYLTRCGIRLITTAGQDVTPGSVWRCTHIGAGGSPVWSPDGRKITASGTEGVYVMNGDGSGLRTVWKGPAASPSWRPLPR